MFDTETLGVRERSVVTTLACIPFCFEDDLTYEAHIENGLYIKFDVKEQIKQYQRTTDKDTLEWWKKQSDEAKQHSLAPSVDDVSLAVGCQQLRDFIKSTNYDFKTSWAWSRGSYFDFPKIEDLYRDLGQRAPYNGFKVRDTRTMIDVLTGSLNGDYDLENGTPQEFLKHHALHDCALEVAKVKEIFKLL